MATCVPMMQRKISDCRSPDGKRGGLEGRRIEQLHFGGHPSGQTQEL